ncbi:MAG: hypothetical protein V1685_04180 [Parcubacteria group bacterium]
MSNISMYFVSLFFLIVLFSALDNYAQYRKRRVAYLIFIYGLFNYSYIVLMMIYSRSLERTVVVLLWTGFVVVSVAYMFLLKKFQRTSQKV